MYESEFSLYDESHNQHQNAAECQSAQHVIMTARSLTVNDVLNCVNSVLNV